MHPNQICYNKNVNESLKIGENLLKRNRTVSDSSCFHLLNGGQGNSHKTNKRSVNSRILCEAKLPLRDTLEIPLYQGSSSSRRGCKEPQACKHQDHKQMCVYTLTDICVHTHVFFETRSHVARARFALAR